jgi:hypothetical protein
MSSPVPGGSLGRDMPRTVGTQRFSPESTEYVPDPPAGSSSGAMEPSWSGDKEKKIRTWIPTDLRKNLE